MTTWRTRPQPQITVSVGLDVGRARHGRPNEDAIGVYTDFCQDPERIATKGLLFMIADGMGGAVGGAVASRTAVGIVGTSYYDDPDLEVMPSLERAIAAANSQIHELGQTDAALYGLGTTLVAAVILGDNVVVANVGDSRAYQLRQGELFLLTVDHTVVQEQVRAGLLSDTEAVSHPQRHALSRNLGSLSWTQPDCQSSPLLAGDTLLLCSDGLWGAISNAEIAELLQNHPAPAAIPALIDLANEHGGPDNISAIVIDFGGAAADTLLPASDLPSPLPDLAVLPPDEAITETATESNTPWSRVRQRQRIVGVAVLLLLAVLIPYSALVASRGEGARGTTGSGLITAGRSTIFASGQLAGGVLPQPATPTRVAHLVMILTPLASPHTVGQPGRGRDGTARKPRTRPGTLKDPPPAVPVATPTRSLPRSRVAAERQYSLLLWEQLL